MTLQDFDKQIDPVILKRGKEYFNNDSVEFLKEIKKDIGLQTYQEQMTILLKYR